MSATKDASHSLSVVRIKIDHLREVGMLKASQYESIIALLPKLGDSPPTDTPPTSQSVSLDKEAERSKSFSRFGNDTFASAMTQAAQDPDHPANPNNSKHGEWADKMSSKVGNAAIFGAGFAAGGKSIPNP